ncbi:MULTISPECIES: MCE family protein [Nocardiaceae]|jgi:phospholipid/cholesterol/gamma-HCH transport system substrate-binding protein|uniref:MCE family protein n=1 Tax=Nocardiaceae TaxID=85025 RepID=UPI0022A82B21|nr:MULTISPECIES: MCE family protein [Rhodococcus]MCC8926920.1 MCE family protein [Rhodococcus sp. I2R]MCZ4276974.1 MCE family protein [Rhodococcus yunnanensis]
MRSGYRERDHRRIAVIGTAVILSVVLASMGIRSLPIVAGGASYNALFVDAGGLKTGDRVVVSGVALGSVSTIAISGAAVKVNFTIESPMRLGLETTAQIATATVLGAKELRVVPRGDGSMAGGDTIGIDRTLAPYDLTDALGDFATTSDDIDTDQLADSMRVLSETLSDTPDDLGATLDGVARLSETVASRDRSLRELLDNSNTVTAVLAERSEQVNALVLDSNSILLELLSRQQTLDQLFRNIDALAVELTGLVDDNQAEIGPTLDHLNSVLAVLIENRDDIALAIERLGPYVTQLGEAVASGPFFSSYIQNLIPGQIIEPFVSGALEATR